MFKIQNFGFWKSEPQKTYSAVSGDDASSESSNATNLKYGKEMRPSNDTIREDSLPRFRRPHHISKSRKFRSICLAGAATVVTITVFVLFMTLFGDKYMGRERDLDFPSSSVVFEEVHGFSEPPSPETNQLWNTLLPPGRGFVFVDDPEKQHLLPGIETESGRERYSVALFHQLHCLGMLRKAYFNLILGVSADLFTNPESLLSEVQHQNHTHHIHHCFDYLRQSIMCSGDMTLESSAVEDDGSRITVDGWGVSHQCKNWDSIWEYMLNNHSPHNNTDIA